jgi:hypothetical protein
MKTIRFSTRKKPLFAFEAETVSYEPDTEGAILLHAEGSVKMQEEIAVQEMFSGDYPGFLSVTENEEEIMHQGCSMTFLQLDEGSFTARIILEEKR